MKNFIIISCCILALLASCSSKSKDDEPENPILTNTELLTLGKWTTTLSYLKKSDGTCQKGSNPCGEDNYWEFKTDGTLEFGEGPLLCDPSEPAPDPIIMDWRLENNDQRLVLVFPFDEAFYQIVSITEHEMVLDGLVQGTFAVTEFRTILQR